MDHGEALQQKATERYLLDELDPEVKDQFEEHLFDCQECALDVRAAAMFVEQSKVVLAEAAMRRRPCRTALSSRGRRLGLLWFRPALGRAGVRDVADRRWLSESRYGIRI